MDLEVLLLILRLAIVVLLYCFVVAVVVIGFRRLQPATTPGVTATTAGPRLEVLDPGETGIPPGTPLPLAAPRTTLGRLPESNVYLDDETVSGRHAVLERRPDGSWWVEDLGSTNGSFVDGTPVLQPTLVRPGAVLVAGRVRMRLVP